MGRGHGMVEKAKAFLQWEGQELSLAVKTVSGVGGSQLRRQTISRQVKAGKISLGRSSRENLTNHPKVEEQMPVLSLSKGRQVYSAGAPTDGNVG
jgi:hypothetical protein